MTAVSSRPSADAATTNNVLIDIVIESPKWNALPAAADVVCRAITVAAAEAVPRLQLASIKRGQIREVGVLLCDDEAIAAFNARWRGQAKPTNVLSFPAMTLAMRTQKSIPLGDIAIAYETLAQEAVAQHKRTEDHLAHLAIHGFLHLLGYDHQGDEEAERMERLERDLLERIGIADPYQTEGAGA